MIDVDFYYPMVAIDYLEELMCKYLRKRLPILCHFCQLSGSLAK